MTEKILICGFGRMGISHTLQTLGYFRSRGRLAEIYICDTSLISRAVAAFVCPSVCFITPKKLQTYDENHFEFAIDCTPPSFRSDLVPVLQRIAKRCLVEKPVLVELDSSSMSGYVLQHNPLVAELKALVADAKAISIDLLTNVDFTSAGWRSGKSGGLANEYLGHCLSVPAIIYPQLAQAKLVSTSVDSNSVLVRLEAPKLRIDCKLRADCEDVRKASYSWNFFSDSEACADSNCVEFDLYQITRSHGQSSEVLAGVAQRGVSVPFYLRGFDFANQNSRLIEGRGDVFGKESLRAIERLVSEVAEIEYENRFRG